jgi:hypothetical protein
VDEFHHGLRQFLRIPRLLVIPRSGLGPHRTRRCLIVFNDARGHCQRGGIEKVGAEEAWLNHRDVNAQRRELIVQRFAQALNGKLGRAIYAEARHRPITGDC